jgi:hypothetical protein
VSSHGVRPLSEDFTPRTLPMGIRKLTCANVRIVCPDIAHDSYRVTRSTSPIERFWPHGGGCRFWPRCCRSGVTAFRRCDMRARHWSTIGSRRYPKGGIQGIHVSRKGRTRWHSGHLWRVCGLNAVQAAACKSAVSSSGMSICTKCVQGSVRTVQPDRDFSFS